MDADLQSLITKALEEVCFGSEEAFPLQATIDRYFAPDFVEVVDGAALGRREFAAQMGGLRSMVTGGRVEALAAIRQGDDFAHRHVLHLTGADGATVRREVFMFGRLAPDGRLLRIDEVSRQAGAEGGCTTE